LGPDSILRTLFLNNLKSSNEVSRRYTTADKTMILYILIFTFLDSSYKKRIHLCRWS
jgi:hypothetical protein